MKPTTKQIKYAKSLGIKTENKSKEELRKEIDSFLKKNIKMGSKDMAFWEEVLKKVEQDLEGIRKSEKLSVAMLEMAKIQYKKAEAEWKKR